MPLMNGTTALIVDEYKLLLGPQQFSFWQGPAFPNGSNSEPYGRWPPYNMADCGKAEIKMGNETVQKMEGGCLFNIREDPHETKDLAKSEPVVLERMKRRYLELKATALDQRTPLETVVNRTKLYQKNWIQMLQRNKGFIGPWCNDGACEPLGSSELSESELPYDAPYNLGGPFPGFNVYESGYSSGEVSEVVV